MRTLISSAVALVALTLPAIAQNATTIAVAESEKFGKYLTTGDGRPVYLFTTDTRAMGDQDAKISCTSQECLGAWPLVTSSGDPQASGEAKSDRLGTTRYEGQTVVTYNGWPLYYFIRDQGADAPQGQEIKSFGGEWYLVTAEGEKVETK
jgi:predicted lipoprotein with Yx(FWY)xxD motif